MSSHDTSFSHPNKKYQLGSKKRPPILKNLTNLMSSRGNFLMHPKLLEKNPKKRSTPKISSQFPWYKWRKFWRDVFFGGGVHFVRDDYITGPWKVNDYILGLMMGDRVWKKTRKRPIGYWKKLFFCVYRGLYILPSFVGIIINHYKEFIRIPTKQPV